MEEWEKKLEKAICSVRASLEMEGLSVSEETIEAIRLKYVSMTEEQEKK